MCYSRSSQKPDRLDVHGHRRPTVYRRPSMHRLTARKDMPRVSNISAGPVVNDSLMMPWQPLHARLRTAPFATSSTAGDCPSLRRCHAHCSVHYSPSLCHLSSNAADCMPVSHCMTTLSGQVYLPRCYCWVDAADENLCILSLSVHVWRLVLHLVGRQISC